jgi:hypothetical protein
MTSPPLIRTLRVASASAVVIAAAFATAAMAAPPTGVDPPSGQGAFGVELVEDGNGVLATWIEPNSEGATVRFSRFEQGADPAWTPPRAIVESAELFANWADRPAVRRLPDGSLLAHDLRKIAAGTYAYGVRVSRSTDDGATWQDLGWLHDDTRAVEHGFVSMVPTADGVTAFWLDGREMIEQVAGEGHGHDHGAGGGAMTLRTATLSAAPPPGVPTVPASIGLDARVCECCGTDAAITAAGPVIVYRDRGPNEERDIFIVRREGDRWSNPEPVSRDGWIMPGCPVNGPSVAAHVSAVCVAWFTAAAGDPEDPSPPRSLAAWSLDGGATFAAPVELSSTSIGRTDLVMLPDGSAVACWVDRLEPPVTGGAATDRSREMGSIALRRLRADGSAGPVVYAAPIDLGRLAGFPRLVRASDGGTALLLAWRDESTDRLRSMLVAPPA